MWPSPGFVCHGRPGALPSAPPFFGRAQEVHFARGVTLFHAVPRDTQAGWCHRRGHSARLERGVQQLRLKPETLPEVVRDAGLSPARGNELTWTVQRRPDALGPGVLPHGAASAWPRTMQTGGQAQALAGWGRARCRVGTVACACAFRQRAAFGFSAADTERLASEFADLRCSLARRGGGRAGAPGSDRRGELLPVAMRELLDGVPAWSIPYSYRGRLDALAGYVRQLPRERIEDYVAALVGARERPLRPVDLEPGP